MKDSGKGRLMEPFTTQLVVSQSQQTPSKKATNSSTSRSIAHQVSITDSNTSLISEAFSPPRVSKCLLGSLDGNVPTLRLASFLASSCVSETSTLVISARSACLGCRTRISESYVVESNGRSIPAKRAGLYSCPSALITPSAPASLAGMKSAG